MREISLRRPEIDTPFLLDSLCYPEASVLSTSTLDNLYVSTQPLHAGAPRPDAYKTRTQTGSSCGDLEFDPTLQSYLQTLLHNVCRY